MDMGRGTPTEAKLYSFRPAKIPSSVPWVITPPTEVKLVMEAVCVMKEVKPDKVKDPEGGLQKVNDFWGPSVKMLADSKFLDSLKTYDKDNIPGPMLKKIKKYVNDEAFSVEPY